MHFLTDHAPSAQTIQHTGWRTARILLLIAGWITIIGGLLTAAVVALAVTAYHGPSHDALLGSVFMVLMITAMIAVPSLIAARYIKRSKITAPNEPVYHTDRSSVMDGVLHGTIVQRTTPPTQRTAFDQLRDLDQSYDIAE